MSGFACIGLSLRAGSSTPINPDEFFLAMGSNQTRSAQSSDLTNWAAGGSFVSGGSFRDVCYSSLFGLNGRYLTCANLGGAADVAYTDDNGTTWTTQSTGQFQSYDTCEFAFTNFYVGSNNGNIFKSPTGLTGSWTSSLFPSALLYRSYDLWFNGSILASVGNATSSNILPRIAYTLDGSSWSAGVVTGLLSGVTPNNTLYAVAWDTQRSLWWVCNGDGQIYSNPTLTSGSWTLKFDHVDVSSDLHRFAFGNGSIVVCTGAGGIWASTDNGATFVEYEPTVVFRDVQWSDRYECFVAVGAGIWVSALGTAWTQLTTPPGLSYCALSIRSTDL